MPDYLFGCRTVKDLGDRKLCGAGGYVVPNASRTLQACAGFFGGSERAHVEKLVFQVPRWPGRGKQTAIKNQCL